MAALSAGDLEAGLRRIQDAALSRDDIDALLGELATRIGLEALALDGAGQAEIVVDGDVEVLLMHAPDYAGLVAASSFAHGAAQATEVRRRVLQANMSWAETHGGVFALDPTGEDLLLCRILPVADRSAERLERELSRFVDLVKDWRIRLAALENGGPATAAPPPEAGLRA